MKKRDGHRLAVIAAATTSVVIIVLAVLAVLASTASSTAITVYTGLEAIGTTPGMVGNYLVADGTALVLSAVALLVLFAGMIVTSRMVSTRPQATLATLRESREKSSRRDRDA